MSFNIPILLITFNRPETTKRVLEAVLSINPEKIYVFSDAPRDNNQNDAVNVAHTRSLFDNLDSPFLKVNRNFQDTNLGCGRGVTTAINWAFANEEKLIILEDDCLPGASFFSFCEYILNKYQFDERVMHVAGTRWNDEYHDDNSYMFSQIGHIWGWATWKRAWEKYNFNMPDWPTNANILKDAFTDITVRQYWKDLFNDIYFKDYKFTWDYQWQYTLFKYKGLAVIPDKNLISNIGVIGTHMNLERSTNERNAYLFNKATHNWEVEKIPQSIKANAGYDNYHMKNHFMRSYTFIQKAKKKIKYLLNG